MDEKPPKPEVKTRRPYVKPEFHSVELFERRSLACGSNNASTRQGCVIHQSVG